MSYFKNIEKNLKNLKRDYDEFLKYQENNNEILQLLNKMFEEFDQSKALAENADYLLIKGKYHQKLLDSLLQPPQLQQKEQEKEEKSPRVSNTEPYIPNIYEPRSRNKSSKSNKSEQVINKKIPKIKAKKCLLSSDEKTLSKDASNNTNIILNIDDISEQYDISKMPEPVLYPLQLEGEDFYYNPDNHLIYQEILDESGVAKLIGKFNLEEKTIQINSKRICI